MITPIVQPASMRGNINEADLIKLLTAIGSADVIALPAGKTLQDLQSVHVQLLPTPLPDGSVASFNASLKVV